MRQDSPNPFLIFFPSPIPFPFLNISLPFTMLQPAQDQVEVRKDALQEKLVAVRTWGQPALKLHAFMYLFLVNASLIL